MDFGKKEHRIGDLFYPSGDTEKDLAFLTGFFEGVRGKIPANS